MVNGGRGFRAAIAEHALAYMKRPLMRIERIGLHQKNIMATSGGQTSPI